MRFFLILLILCQSVYAQISIVTDVSQNFPEAPSDGEIRSALLFEAALQAAKTIAPELGFDQENFDRRLSEKFADHFNIYREKKLTDKFGANYRASMTENERKDFLTGLEDDRQAEFIRFTRLKDTIRSYTFKQLSSDELNPKVWKARVELILDKAKLLKMYRRIIQDENRPYSKILLRTEIGLNNMVWTDLGLEGPDSFISPLRSSWIKWLEENLPTTVEEALPCVKECLAFWETWSQTPQEELPAKIPLEYSDSVWLSIDLSFSRTEFSSELNQLGMDWDGRVVLTDTNTKRIIATFEIGAEKKTFRGQNQQAINSVLASAVYRSPLGTFVQLSKILAEKVGLNRVSRLVIRGHRHLGDALDLVEKLKTRGASLGLEVGLHAFTKEEAHLRCFYRGEEKSFTDLLSGLKELKSSQSYTLVNEFTGVHHVLKLVTD